MKFIADFHLHSKYSRATSKDMDLENLNKWAKIKGIKVLGTGDFTHPEWFKNLKEKLKPAETGLFQLKKSGDETRFILTAEISCIYSKGGKVRKIHLIIFAPTFESVEKINVKLGRIGNVKSDGRPILGLDAKEVVKIALEASKECLVIPAHCMTPWFSIFGSKSGFDSIEECFEEYSKYIYALETGLSADPKMLWRIPDGRKVALISNSDCHSPSKIGREANVFDTEISYPAIIDAIKAKDPKRFLNTIEFFPEEGKYHYDGHRNCNVSLSPQESKKSGNICPVCGKALTIGVLNRVAELADRPARNATPARSDAASSGEHSVVGGEEGIKPKKLIPFKSLIPLEEIIADALGVKKINKKGEIEYKNLIKKFGTEFNILLEVSCQELKSATLPEIAEGVIKVREGKVEIKPGYDGVYGRISLFSKGEQKKLSKQKTLF